MKIQSRLILIFLIFSFILLPVYFVYPFSAQVRDISDRAYEKAVWTLLDNAEESIVISQYCIKPGDNPRHPVNRFLKDLIEARDRGVEVKIYLNTKISGQSFEDIINQKWIKDLEKAGCRFFFMSPNVRLHDKLIIIDAEIVIDGSMNWTVTALKDNKESAVVIYSKELAEIKLTRLKQLSIVDNERERMHETTEDWKLFSGGIPEEISVPYYFIKVQAPKMYSDSDHRSMKIYLLALFLNNSRQNGFSLNLEKAGVYIGMDKEYGRVNIRRQIIKTLRKLKDRYKLIDVKFHFAKDVWIKPLYLDKEAFTLKSAVLSPEDLKSFSNKEIIDILKKSSS